MIDPPKVPSKLLQGKDQICQCLQIGEKRFSLWVQRGLPVRLVDGRYIAHRDTVERFFEDWITNNSSSTVEGAGRST